MQKEDEARRGSTPRIAGTAPEAKTDAPKPAAGTTPGRVGEWRADLGLRPVSALLPRLTRPVFRKRSPAAAHLISDWAEIVGPVLAAQSVPQKFSAGTLTLGCSGPVAMELQYLEPQLVAKINTALGQKLVNRIRLVQVKLPAAAARKPARKPAPALPPQLAEKLERIADPDLRAALARLGQGIYRGKRAG